MSEKKIDWRIRQSNREAVVTLAAYAVYFLWWYGFAYGLGNGDPDEYTYVLGLPTWFFYSCILGYLVLTLVLWIMMRLFFRDVPLDADADGGGGPSPGGNTPERLTEMTGERHPEVL